MASLYKQSISTSIKYLRNLSNLLDKAVKFADEKGKKHEDMLEFRLIADMRGLTYQVQSACNTAKFMLQRVGGLSDTYFDDPEKTFADMQSRITRTVELLQTVDQNAFDSRAKEPAIMKTSMGTFGFATGEQYINKYAVSNFHFHLTTAYCILRHLGVPIGAFHYLGKDTFVKVEDK